MTGSRRWLVKFGYDGRPFAGWARQPGLRTVEGEIGNRWASLHRTTVAPLELEVASRTDRGVSARANALTVRVSSDGDRLLRQLNGLSPAIRFWAATAVPDEFRLRRAQRRTYRYFEPAEPGALPRWRAAAEVLRGPIDVRSFGRGIPADVPVLRTVESVSVLKTPGGLCLEVSAPSFVWGMVRKIVGAIRSHAAGRLDLKTLEDAVSGARRLTLPMAEAEGLVLWDVEYDLPWTHVAPRPTRGQQEYAQTAQREVWRRELVMASLENPVEPGRINAPGERE